LAFALVISAVLHAAAITMPGWELAGVDELESAPLEARLVPPRPAPVVTAAAPPPAKRRPPRVAPVRQVAVADDALSMPVETAAPAAHAEAPVPLPEPLAEPIVEQAAAEPQPPMVATPPPWPRAGRLHYVVTYGEGAFIIGETVHDWQVEDGRYSIRSVATPRGLAALRGKTRSQSSAGEITADGLRPLEFRDQREGREAEAAAFDWAQTRVIFSGGRGEARLSEGTQDMISVFYQLAWQAPRQNVRMAVATAGRLGSWEFEWLGEETIEAAGASFSTLHLRTRADGDITEVWLAPAHGGLPVKIRHVDRKGDTYEQTADTLEING
jgi:hypothetical protein